MTTETKREAAIRMAREIADKDKVDPVNSQGDMITLTPEELSRLIAIAQAEQRERDARILEQHPTYDFCKCPCECAAAIRSQEK